MGRPAKTKRREFHGAHGVAGLLMPKITTRTPIQNGDYLDAGRKDPATR